MLECKNCKLMFRHPRFDFKHNFKFYNHKYKQSGITTDLPEEKHLQHLIETKFKNTLRSTAISQLILNKLSGDISNKSILDYGCSWGYATWQFQDIGMKAYGYEISRERAAFGLEHLGVSNSTDTKDFKESKFDFIYSSHVIEHLPDLKSFANFCLSLLKPNGFIVLLCPNASIDFKTRNPNNFHLFWGQEHPNMISDKFLKHMFKNLPLYIASDSYNLEHLATWDQKSILTNLKGGNELLCIIKNTPLKKSV